MWHLFGILHQQKYWAFSILSPPPLFAFLFFYALSFSPLLSQTGCTTQTATKSFQKFMTLPTQQASVAWTFHLRIIFFGTFISPSGWNSWGMNLTSPEMTGTRALIAFPYPNSGQIVLLPYILDPTVKLQKSPLLSRPLDIHILFRHIRWPSYPTVPPSKSSHPSNYISPQKPPPTYPQVLVGSTKECMKRDSCHCQKSLAEKT